MKNIINFLILMVILLLTILYQNDITGFIMREFIHAQKVNITEEAINHKENLAFFLSRTDDFIIKENKDIPNVIYTILDNGWSEFTFYCDYRYTSCIDDFRTDFDNEFLLASINSAIHPYNTYRNIVLQVSKYNKLTLRINKLYSTDKIAYLNNKVDTLYNELINEQMTMRQKIKIFHDYIIQHTIYDQNYQKDVNNANNAYGVFAEGKAVCSGYTDAMQLFLIKMGIPNYKLTSDNHIWNYVYLDNQWYHLDVSWDDPVTTNGQNKLIHDYFLIDDPTLKSYNDGEHNYNNIFIIKQN